MQLPTLDNLTPIFDRQGKMAKTPLSRRYFNASPAAKTVALTDPIFKIFITTFYSIRHRRNINETY
jgi:hypothetical protein